MKFVEYLESNGTQYIDTNILAQSNLKIELQAELTTKDGSQAFFGGQNSASNNRLAWYYYKNNEMYYYYASSRYPYVKRSDFASKHIYVFDSYKVYIDGEEVSFSASVSTTSFTSSYTMYLFARNLGGTVSDMANMKLYYFKVWKNDELLGDFVPALDENEVPCLYDKVTESYFYNAGTGSFTAGNVIEEPDFDPESTTKYLIRSEDTLFSIVDDELVFLEETELTSDVFHSHGLDELPDWTLLMELTNPEILYWQESEEDELPVLKATLTAVPVPQTITVPIDLSHPTILGVQKVTTECTGNPLFAFSFDDGATWKVHNGTDWTNGTEMTKDVLEAITTEQWTQAIEGMSSFMLKITLNTTEDTVTKVVIDYINEGE